MSKKWLWVQLFLAWMPIAALLATLVFTAHPHTTVSGAIIVALRMSVAGAVLGLLVYRLVRRVPWPRAFDLRFGALHIAAAVAFTIAFFILNSVIESLARGQLVIVIGAGVAVYLVFGVWLYIMITGVVYANEATARAAHAEAIAARSQLAALRAQVNPHFLFNALHSVVHLIPRDPARAARAAEQVAGLLRATLEEKRDLVPLAEELGFVRRYLELERLRFGDRLTVAEHVDDEALDILVPVFSVQTLIENAVRHGAAPRVGRTTIDLTATATNGTLAVSVRDDGDGAAREVVDASNGTGLKRLRERLAVLYDRRARLDVDSSTGKGFVASLSLPAVE
jgi:hypothetical protein